jgi:hypothetical protein
MRCCQKTNCLIKENIPGRWEKTAMRLFLTSIIAALVISGAADARKLSEAEMDATTAAGTKVKVHNKLVADIPKGKSGKVEKQLPGGGYVKVLVSADGATDVKLTSNSSASVITTSDGKGNKTVSVDSPKTKKSLSSKNTTIQSTSISNTVSKSSISIKSYSSTSSVIKWAFD